MTDILKGEWGFDGFVEADWAAVAEMRACPPENPDTGDCGHGFAADGPDAAAIALNAGMDSEMTSTFIRDFGAQLVSQHRVSIRGSTTPCGGSCGSSSGPGCSTTRTRRVPGRGGPDAAGRGGARARTRPARWCC